MTLWSAATPLGLLSVGEDFSGKDAGTKSEKSAEIRIAEIVKEAASGAEIVKETDEEVGSGQRSGAQVDKINGDRLYDRTLSVSLGAENYVLSAGMPRETERTCHTDSIAGACRTKEGASSGGTYAESGTCDRGGRCGPFSFEEVISSGKDILAGYALSKGEPSRETLRGLLPPIGECGYGVIGGDASWSGLTVTRSGEVWLQTTGGGNDTAMVFSPYRDAGIPDGTIPRTRLLDGDLPILVEHYVSDGVVTRIIMLCEPQDTDRNPTLWVWIKALDIEKTETSAVTNAPQNGEKCRDVTVTNAPRDGENREEVTVTNAPRNGEKPQVTENKEEKNSFAAAIRAKV